MTDMKEEIVKSSELKRPLRCTSLSNMPNCQKDAKDMYFGTLEYDKAMYPKHLQELSSNVHRAKSAGVGVGTKNGSDSEDMARRIPTRMTMPMIPVQEEN